MPVEAARVYVGGKWRRVIHCNNCGRQAISAGQGLCRTCYSRWHYAQNKEKYHAAGRRYYHRNLEAQRRRSRKYHACNRAREREYSSRYRQEHPGRRQSIEAAYRERNRERERQRAADYRKEHPGKRRITCKKWYEENKERVFAQARRRGARLHNVPVNDFTVADWQVVLDHYGHRCAYCGGAGPLERDHIIPLSRGGFHTISNIAPACRFCNASKGSRTPAEARMYLWLLPVIIDKSL